MDKVFIEYRLNLNSGYILMFSFSVNLTFDQTLIMQFCYFILQKSPLLGYNVKVFKTQLKYFVLSC